MAVTPVGQNRPQPAAQFEATPAAAQKSGSGATAYAEARASVGQDKAVQAQLAKDTFDPNAGVQAQQANALGNADSVQNNSDDQFSQALDSLVQCLNSVVQLVQSLLPPEETAETQPPAGGENAVGQGTDPATIAPGEPGPNADPNAAITRDMLDARGGGPAEGDPLEAAGGGPTRFGVGPQGPGLQGTQHGSNGVAGINQNDPNADGDNADYKFGQTNCAPTAMAEIARGRALADPNYSIEVKGPDGNMQSKRVAEMSNEELVTALGVRGDTNNEGTSPNGVIDMANALGEPVTDAEVHYQKGWEKGQPSHSFDQEWLDKRLQDGEKVVVNGAYQVKDAEGKDNLVGHYMTISGKNANGNYNVVDPWDGKVKELSADEVRRFMEHNPYNGGIMLAIGKTAAEQNAQG